LFTHEHIFTFKHLCLHPITKILRNGPRAHFPFRCARAHPPGVAPEALEEWFDSSEVLMLFVVPRPV
jgi:hypothetical protein